MDGQNPEDKLMRLIFGNSSFRQSVGQNPILTETAKFWICPYCQVLFPRYGGSEGMLRKRSTTHLKKVHGIPTKDVDKLLHIS